MASHGSDYYMFKLTKSFQGERLERLDRLTLIRNKVRENIKTAFETTRKRYNLRATSNLYAPGELVWRRNFVLSDATKRFCAKLAPKFIPAVVVESKGNSLYVLKDEASGKSETYHSKDIKPRKV